ncbi:hypothetical protein [Nocardia asteroides]|uniref:hypothetical protein n=1 Tax=Nocardia asteroides TaxID=1824 RepID=UPI00342D057A
MTDRPARHSRPTRSARALGTGPVYVEDRVDGAPGRVLVDLDFDDRPGAEAFRTALAAVLASPRSRAMVIRHEAWLVDLVEERVPA